MRLQVLGCGDAFGSGGRLQTAFHVTTSTTAFLIDCGTTALIGLRRAGLDPNAVATVVISHLHGDHFAGLPFFLLDAQLISRRREPLTIVGPQGIEQRLVQAAEVMFPGSSEIRRKFQLEFLEHAPDVPLPVNDLQVTAFEVSHPSGAPAFALRITSDGKTVTYTGDTEWVETLVPAAHGADLLIAEAYFFERTVKHHLDYQTLAQNLDRLQARRVMLTHMSPEMLAKASDLDAIAAEDGLILDI